VEHGAIGVERRELLSRVELQVGAPRPGLAAARKMEIRVLLAPRLGRSA
jgi:hypothetical protein